MQVRLYALRKDKGLTQKEVADYLNIAVKTYRNKELGKSEFTASEMFALSKLFKKTIEKIFLPSKVPARNKSGKWVKQ